MKRAALLAALLCAAAATPARAAGPPRLSRATTHVSVRSTHGSGSFGRWTTGVSGLPAYRYAIDEQTAPQAPQPELAGSRDAWHQLGNDHVVATAYNHGYVQLWSQDRFYEWTNRYDASTQHYAGGYGYLRLGGRTYSTLYDDRSPGTTSERIFGLGYFGRRTAVPGARVTERVYAPYGDDPTLLHDVTVANTSGRAEDLSWTEYWDVNPVNPLGDRHGTAAPRYDRATRTIAVDQLPSAQDTDPLSIFAAQLDGPAPQISADTHAFFGTGGRAAPSEVARDHLGGDIALPAPSPLPGQAMAAFRAPVHLAPGASVTLHYAYGYAHRGKIAALVARTRQRAAVRFTNTEHAWRSFVPQASFGRKYTWLSRELQWDAYMVRSGASYEECAGHHVISQGGYYQYGLDFQGAFRDPLEHALPMIYADPSLAREVVLYSAGEQGRLAQQIPYARIQSCAPLHLGTSDDLDLWLMWVSAEYGLASRDTAFFDQRVPWTDGGSATLWEHLKRAFAHQESQRSAHGVYVAGATGDWSDLITEFAQMSESTLVATQALYMYPRLAALARLRGDTAFAKQLDAATAGLRKVVDREWVSRGWYARGYTAGGRFGTGAIYGEPQPWAILGHAPSKLQARRLVTNIRRYLTGVGAPGGPTRIGSSQSPADDDPGVTEHSPGGHAGVGDKHAVYVGGAWYAVDGWLAWALGTLDRVVPHARTYAFSEFRRNTLAAHATAYPNHWDGVISVDDACRSWYSTEPAQCGVGLSTAYDTQIMHQPAWSLYDAVMLAGITPTASGYTITPHLPMAHFSLRLPRVGVTAETRRLRGYVRVARTGTLTMRVAAPAGSTPRRVRAYANGRRVRTVVAGHIVRFRLPARAGRAADWALVAPRRKARR